MAWVVEDEVLEVLVPVDRAAEKGACGYTGGMKTAVSLPNELFRAAEEYAGRVRMSRSQLYAEALSEYLARHAPEEVTETMNQVMDELGNAVDPFVTAAGTRVLERSEW